MAIYDSSNQQILEQLGKRFQNARLNENLSRKALAQASGLTEKTLSNLEKGSKSVGLLNVIAILRALDLLEQIDRFLPQPPPRAAQLLKSQNTLRQRASKQSSKSQPEAGGANEQENWIWGEDQNNEQ